MENTTQNASGWRVETYISNHARVGAQVFYRVVDPAGKTVAKGYRSRRAAEIEALRRHIG